MRTLKFATPYKLQNSRIEDGERFDNPSVEYYSRFVIVWTKNGIVAVLEFDWATNKGQMQFTEFKTVVEGMVYSAECPEVKLRDRQIKWMATNFMNKVIEKMYGTVEVKLRLEKEGDISPF